MKNTIKYKRGTGKLTGVYQIRNLINSKVYIGSAQLRFSIRKTHHFSQLNNNRHYNIHLQRSWNKHSEKNFIFEILEICDKEFCIEREQYYIDTLKPEYNLAKVAGASGAGVKLSEERKKQISKFHKGKKYSKETRLKISKALKGRIGPNLGGTITQEHKNKIGDGNRGKKRTVEERLKLSKALTGRKCSEKTKLIVSKNFSKKLYQYNLEGNFIKEWNSVIECATSINYSVEMIYRKIKENKSYKNYIFKYLKDK